MVSWNCGDWTWTFLLHLLYSPQSCILSTDLYGSVVGLMGNTTSLVGLLGFMAFATGLAGSQLQHHFSLIHGLATGLIVLL